MVPFVGAPPLWVPFLWVGMGRAGTGACPYMHKVPLVIDSEEQSTCTNI